MTTPPTLQQLAGIRARHTAATPGPWDPYPAYGPNFVANQTGESLQPVGDLGFGEGEHADADRAFVQHAHTDVATLLAEVDRLTAGLAGARAAGYQNAADNAAECVRTHGSDADAEMLLVFLRRGAELRTDFAAALARQAAAVTPEAGDRG